MSNYKQLSDKAYLFHTKNMLDEAETIYKGLLNINPNDVNILNLYSLLCLSKGRTKDAVEMLSKALVLDSSNTMIMTNLAKAYYMDGDVQNSVNLYERVINIDPSEDAYYSIAISYKKLGMNNEAILAYEEALKFNPNNYSVLYNLAILYSDVKNIKMALKTAQKAEFVNPNDVDIHTLLAGFYEQENNYKKSILHLEKALCFEEHYLYYYNLGVLYSKISNNNAAIRCYQKVLDLQPNHVETLVNLTSLHKNTDKLKALSFIKQAFSVSPTDEMVRLSLAQLYRDMYQNDDSIEILKDMDSAEAYSLLATNFMDLEQYDLALEMSQKALNIDAKNTNYIHGKAVALKYLQKLDEAKALLESINNKSIQTITTLGMIYLQQKDFYNGMPLYIQRSKDTKFSSIFKSKIWSKDVDLNQKKVLLYSDCGLGDTIMFVRYIPFLQKIAKNVVLQTDIELVSILQENYPDISIYKKSDFVCDYDVVMPIMNLPYALDMDFNNIPFDEAYLKAPENDLSSDKQKIGIFYQGNKRVFKNRSIDYSEIKKLSNINDAQLYSFQIENFDNEDDLVLNLRDKIKDYSDTAALLKSMDVVVTIDSSIAHMAGALGVKTFLLLPQTAEWRWFNDIETTPWYKSVRIFKQTKAGEWSPVINRIIDELSKNEC